MARTLPNGIEVVVNYSLFNKIVSNVFHVVSATEVTDLILQAIVDAFKDWLELDAMQFMSYELGATEIVATDISEPDGIQVTHTFAPTLDGTLVSDAASSNVAICISHLTERTGRSFRGRTYMPGNTLSTIVNNELDPTRQATLLSIYVALAARIEGAGASMVVASFVSGGLPRAVGVGTPITGFSVGKRVDTQRRRLPRE